MAIEIKTKVGSLILQYGPGAMLNEEGYSFLIMDPSNWINSKKRVFDERLQRFLNVDYFAYPERKFPLTIFPKWFSCPQCRHFLPYESWIKGKKGELICPSCGNRGKMLPARFVAICGKGHLDDVDWNAFVHKGKVCSSPSLVLLDKGADTLGSISIHCESCGARRAFSSLINAKDTDKIKCSGATPWRCACSREECSQNAKIVHRGSSSVYFPKIITSLVIPPFSSKLYAFVEKKLAGAKGILRGLGGSYRKEFLNQYATQIILEQNLNEEVARPALLEILETFGDDQQKQSPAMASMNRMLSSSLRHFLNTKIQVGMLVP